jgi:hypothetical protein
LEGHGQPDELYHCAGYGRAVLSWLWLALAYEKQGKAAEARRWLKKAVNWPDQQGGQMPLDANSMGAHPHN